MNRMNVVVALEHRFNSAPDGSIWTKTMFGYSYWQRYLNVFDGVRIVARVRCVDLIPEDWIRVNDEGVTFAPVPYYVGPWQYLSRAHRVRRAAKASIGESDAVLLYLSGQIGSCIDPIMRREGRPYGVYVIADPYDVFGPGSVRHPLRPIFRWLFPRRLRRQCGCASAVAYITEAALQRRYPPGPAAFSTSFPMGEMPPQAYMSAPRSRSSVSREFTLIIVGAMSQMYKAQDVLIDAVAACVDDGLDLRLILVGDGRHRPELEARADARGLGRRVCFKGELTFGASVRDELDKGDLFVLPSRQEGLPRAMIEAMARGLPCIGSTVGGIPELLPDEDMVPPGDAIALSSKIREVLSNPDRMYKMSDRNLKRARAFSDVLVGERRDRFYRRLRETTETWLENRLR